MRLLLDTHAFLWFAAGDARLSPAARRRIEDARHDKYLSVASIWEVAIKLSLAKIQLALSVDDLVDEGAINNGMAVLDITRKHASGVAQLPFHHRDPFDRLLVSQALSEGMSIVSRDTVFDAYPVARIW